MIPPFEDDEKKCPVSSTQFFEPRWRVIPCLATHTFDPDSASGNHRDFLTLLCVIFPSGETTASTTADFVCFGFWCASPKSARECNIAISQHHQQEHVSLRFGTAQTAKTRTPRGNAVPSPAHDAKLTHTGKHTAPREHNAFGHSQNAKHQPRIISHADTCPQR